MGKKMIVEGVPNVKKPKTFIYTTLQVEGYHSFPESAKLTKFATGDRNDVSHLAHKHHHYFIVRVWIQVSHNNRDIEFIQLRRWLETEWLHKHYGTSPVEFGNKSCEMIAEELFELVREAYPANEIKIDVSEDALNGAHLEFTPEEFLCL